MAGNKDKIYDEESFEDGYDLVEFEGEDGERFSYLEEMVFEVDGTRFAVLIPYEEEEEAHEGHTHHEGHEAGCDCGCEYEADAAIFAKIVVNADGDEEYVEPSDEEFEAARKAYEEMMDDEAL